MAQSDPSSWHATPRPFTTFGVCRDGIRHPDPRRGLLMPARLRSATATAPLPPECLGLAKAERNMRSSRAKDAGKRVARQN